MHLRYENDGALVLADSEYLGKGYYYFDSVNPALGNTTAGAKIVWGMMRSDYVCFIQMGEDGKLASIPAATPDVVDENSNYLCAGANTTLEYGGVLNGLVMQAGKGVVLKNTSGTVNVVKSGMIALKDQTGNNMVTRLGTDGWSTSAHQKLTTSAPGGLMVVENNSSYERGRSSTGANRRFLVSSQIADPAAGTSLRLTLAGPATGSPLKGA